MFKNFKLKRLISMLAVFYLMAVVTITFAYDSLGTGIIMGLMFLVYVMFFMLVICIISFLYRFIRNKCTSKGKGT